MSEENVEIVREMLSRFNRGQYTEVFELIDPNVAWEDPRLIPGGGVHHGHDGVRRWFSRWLGAWQEFVSEPKELLAVGNQVIVVERMRGRARYSGIEVDQLTVSGYVVRHGRVTKRIDYATKAEALEAAGLSE